MLSGGPNVAGKAKFSRPKCRAALYMLGCTDPSWVNEQAGLTTLCSFGAKLALSQLNFVIWHMCMLSGNEMWPPEGRRASFGERVSQGGTPTTCTMLHKAQVLRVMHGGAVVGGHRRTGLREGNGLRCRHIRRSRRRTHRASPLPCRCPCCDYFMQHAPLQ